MRFLRVVPLKQGFAKIAEIIQQAGRPLTSFAACELRSPAPFTEEGFKAFNEIYKRYFPKNPPARIFFCVPEWTGPFDIEIDCIAVTKS